MKTDSVKKQPYFEDETVDLTAINRTDKQTRVRGKWIFILYNISHISVQYVRTLRIYFRALSESVSPANIHSKGSFLSIYDSHVNRFFTGQTVLLTIFVSVCDVGGFESDQC